MTRQPICKTDTGEMLVSYLNVCLISSTNYYKAALQDLSKSHKQLNMGITSVSLASHPQLFHHYSLPQHFIKGVHQHSVYSVNSALHHLLSLSLHHLCVSGMGGGGMYSAHTSHTSHPKLTAVAQRRNVQTLNLNMNLRLM